MPALISSSGTELNSVNAIARSNVASGSRGAAARPAGARVPGEGDLQASTASGSGLIRALCYGRAPHCTNRRML